VEFAVTEARAFVVRGEVDAAVGDDLVEAVGTCGEGPLLLDLSGVTFLDSSGIHALLRIAEAIGPDRCVVLHGERPSVKRVLDLVGIDRAAPNIDRAHHDGAATTAKGSAEGPRRG
jgi:anti-anti-sigma factor